MEKKDGKNYGALKFFESLILIVLIGVSLIIVLDTFFDQMNGDYEDYEEYDDYEYVDYSYDYNDEYYYDDYNGEYDSYYNNIDYSDNEENTSTSDFLSIEDFMSSEEGKEFLEKSNQNLVNTNEVEIQNVVNTTADNAMENTTDDFTTDKEDVYNYHDAQKAMKDKFDKQKEKIEIKDEGKSVNNEIMVSIKNNDEDFLYDITLNTIFFKDKKIVSIDVQDINIIDGNNTKYMKVSEIPNDYDNYEFLISKKYYMEYYNELLNDDISYTAKENYGFVDILAHNQANKRVNRIHFTILFFDEAGKLLDFNTIQDYSIKSNKKETLIGDSIWNKEKGEYLEYDSYKVILDYAENYGY